MAQPTQNPSLVRARELSKFIRERWNPDNRMAPLGIAETLDELASQLEQLEAELLAAQERESQLREVWESVPGDLFDHSRDPGAGEAWREQYIARMVEAKQAQEREKALRDRVEDVREQMHGPLREKLWEALAGSPSEKPGSEERERCLRGQHDDPDNSGMCVRCGVVLDAD